MNVVKRIESMAASVGHSTGFASYHLSIEPVEFKIHEPSVASDKINFVSLILLLLNFFYQ